MKDDFKKKIIEHTLVKIDEIYDDDIVFQKTDDPDFDGAKIAQRIHNKRSALTLGKISGMLPQLALPKATENLIPSQPRNQDKQESLEPTVSSAKVPSNEPVTQLENQRGQSERVQSKEPRPGSVDQKK